MRIVGWIWDCACQVDPEGSKVGFGFLLDERIFFSGRHGDVDYVTAAFQVDRQRASEGIMEG